jgi:hypothetical protein
VASRTADIVGGSMKAAGAWLGGPGLALPLLYALASFVSAGLLFLIEPLFGKMVLPLQV